MKVVDWLFRSRDTGEITIVQLPNISLGLFIAAVLVRAAVRPAGGSRAGLDTVGTMALLWWSGDEILRGVNPWRRLLGSAVLTLTVIGRVL